MLVSDPAAFCDTPNLEEYIKNPDNSSLDLHEYQDVLCNLNVTALLEELTNLGNVTSLMLDTVRALIFP